MTFSDAHELLQGRALGDAWLPRCVHVRLFCPSLLLPPPAHASHLLVPCGPLHLHGGGAARGWRWRGQDGAAAAAALLLAPLASGRPAALRAAFVAPAPWRLAALHAARAAPEAAEAAPLQRGIGRESYPVRGQAFAPPVALDGAVGAEVRCAAPRPGRAAPRLVRLVRKTVTHILNLAAQRQHQSELQRIAELERTPKEEAVKILGELLRDKEWVRKVEAKMRSKKSDCQDLCRIETRI